ncbi:hypothetical protein pneo_cds_227 [Pandoravirus neocaledonia]|uniref:Uncharacterized protein n=1 Tax=Pandoravirus neocaledonia TaxID=2107708 RepID=A0A2U7UBL6_9VIRU|nr:hypothetical protein pneo_cds_227 [Pandoravirus neocaledonia]AVK75834.1 hypothetical protein pneo_cds_227 [Pandoravirus neocaledonia]
MAWRLGAGRDRPVTGCSRSTSPSNKKEPPETQTPKASEAQKGAAQQKAPASFRLLVFLSSHAKEAGDAGGTRRMPTQSPKQSPNCQMGPIGPTKCLWRRVSVCSMRPATVANGERAPPSTP